MIQHIKNVTVIGSGTMGNGICHVFAQAGFKVNMMDINQAAMDKALPLSVICPFNLPNDPKCLKSWKQGLIPRASPKFSLKLLIVI